jgi:AGCS family alanine or glycine:cation symporter
MKYLTGGKFALVYKLVFLFTVFFGSLRKTAFVWDISDLFNGMMAIPNLIGLLGLSLLLRKLTKENINNIK